MGMAASQARLLTITARMHDIEYQAQSIQNAKIALATQSDQVYQEYVAALDEQTLTVKDWQGNVIAANFNNLCGINAVDSSYKYALKDEKGRLIVDRNIAEQYQKYMNQAGAGADAYGFAYYMLIYAENGTDADAKDIGESYRIALLEQHNLINASYESEVAKSKLNKYMSDNGIIRIDYENQKYYTASATATDEDGKPVEEEHNIAPDSELKKLIDACNAAKAGKSSTSSDSTVVDSDLRQLWSIIMSKAESAGYDKASALYITGDDEEYDALIEKYLYQLNKRHSEDIHVGIYGDDGAYTEGAKQTYDEDKFNYYVSIFKQIQLNGGSCVSIANMVSVSDYDGFDGDAASDGDWLRDMIQSGKITIEHVNMDKKNGRVSFASTGVPSDSVLEYTATSSIDSAKLAKVQAEYEHKTKELDRKDKKFDLDLSKLDTQRTALKTEYESVKKVISENIDRTFGIFS